MILLPTKTPASRVVAIGNEPKTGEKDSENTYRPAPHGFGLIRKATRPIYIAVHLAPQGILVALSLEFADELKTPEIEAKVIELERCVRLSPAEVVAVFVKPQSLEGFRETAVLRFGRRGCPES
jgi:hypothetical protein